MARSLTLSFELLESFMALICRKLAGTADELDLSEQAMACRRTLEQLARA